MDGGPDAAAHLVQRRRRETAVRRQARNLADELGNPTSCAGASGTPTEDFEPLNRSLEHPSGLVPRHRRERVEGWKAEKNPCHSGWASDPNHRIGRPENRIRGVRQRLESS